jgi:SAM-dependent methyltransferase
VAPGRVTGIDHDTVHIESANALAAKEGINNATFQIGDALTLPFEDGTFDAAFENNLFVHLAEQASAAAREVYRVLKPQGFFAGRDADADSVVWGNLLDPHKQLDKLFIAWHKSRGSDITLGKRLPSILRQAGFTDTVKSVSADSKGNLEETRSHAKLMVSLLDSAFGRDIVRNGWGDDQVVRHLKKMLQAWGEHPDAFFANVHIEVIGWKPPRTPARTFPQSQERERFRHDTTGSLRT